MPRVQYKNAEGKRLPGVTTVAGAYKGSITGLMTWANRGGLDGKSLEDMYGESTEPGSLAHLMIEDFLKGQKTNTAGIDQVVIDLAAAAFSNWQEWFKQHEIEPIEIEPNIVSEELQVGGTPDLTATVQGKLCLIDWKTGKASYTSNLLQLAAYDLLHQETRGVAFEGFYIIVVPRKDDIPTFSVKYFGTMPSEAYEQFRRLRACYEAEKNLKKYL